MKRYADIVVSTGTRMTDMRFTYGIPEALEESITVGTSVYVPFGRGNRKTPGIVLDIKDSQEEDREVKDILSIVAGAEPLSEESILLAEFMVNEYLSDYTSALATVAAPGSLNDIKPLMRSYYQVTEAGLTAEIKTSAVRQKIVIDLLKNKGQLEQRELLTLSKATTATLKALLKKGYIEEKKQREYRRKAESIASYDKKRLNAKQQEIVDEINKKPASYLICGVTGSGKTEIYLQLVERTLREGKEAIVLVPEISLTPQTIARFQGRFGEQIAILHSRLTVNQRNEEWQKIYRGEVSIAIGARSAIFAPFTNLGLIIIDEEHEQSYLSDKSPKYRTHEIAYFRRTYNEATLILGSATPSIESLYQVDQGKIRRFDLKERANKLALPTNHIIDMREELKANNRSMFSRELMEAMKKALAQKEQVILFLNKRGHTSFVFCRKCGYVHRCEACDVAMTYHKHRNKLICHYCGREKHYTNTCPSCGSKAIKEFGAGTEALEEEVRRYFPHKRTVRADADTMRAKGAYSKVYHGMMNGDIDILLGTQMIAKGFDFPQVTVVGIVAADITLNLPDLRACERSFQLVTQVAGRAGRGDKEGNVYIQTYKPEHYAIEAAAIHDVDRFYQKELAIREENFYPPIYQELHIGIQGVDRQACFLKGKQIRQFIEGYFAHKQIDKRLDGPSPAVIERINRKYRFGILIRTLDRETLQGLGRKILQEFPTSRELNIIVSLNPSNIY